MMLRILDRESLNGRRVRLAFRTTHIDKAGETSSVSFVKAEVVELDASGQAILVTNKGLHLTFPAAKLHPHRRELIGGRELTRDFHNAVEPVTLRWMDESAVKKEFANQKQ